MLNYIKKPDFFILGAPRTGTTSLSIYLGENPNIFFSDPKEPNYFCHDFSDKFRKVTDKKEYLNLFKEAEENQVIGEGSVFYLSSEDAILRILDFNPDAKFIVMVRNPIDIVRSRFFISRYFLDENQKDIRKAWKLIKKRKKGKKIPFTCSDPKLLFYDDVARLGQQLENLYHFVDKKNVKVIVFDDFVSNTLGVYKNVLNFLNVDYCGKKEFPVFNQCHDVRFQPISILAIWLFNKNKKFGKFFKWNVIKKCKKEIDPIFRKELADYFREDVKKLSKLLERDLTYWLD
jgi:hypothetical protein